MTSNVLEDQKVGVQGFQSLDMPNRLLAGCFPQHFKHTDVTIKICVSEMCVCVCNMDDELKAKKPETKLPV